MRLRTFPSINPLATAMSVEEGASHRRATVIVSAIYIIIIFIYMYMYIIGLAESLSSNHRV